MSQLMADDTSATDQIIAPNYPSEGYLRCVLSASRVTMGPDVPRGLVRHPMSPTELR